MGRPSSRGTTVYYTVYVYCICIYVHIQYIYAVVPCSVERTVADWFRGILVGLGSAVPVQRCHTVELPGLGTFGFDRSSHTRSHDCGVFAASGRILCKGLVKRSG